MKMKMSDDPLPNSESWTEVRKSMARVKKIWWSSWPWWKSRIQLWWWRRSRIKTRVYYLPEREYWLGRKPYSGPNTELIIDGSPKYRYVPQAYREYNEALQQLHSGNEVEYARLFKIAHQRMADDIANEKP